MYTTHQRELRNLDDAISFFEETMDAHPDRDSLAAENAAWNGKPHPHLTMGIAYRIDPLDTFDADTFFDMPITQFSDDDEGRIAQKIVHALAPLDMLNPVCKSINLEGATSPADMIPCFGIPQSPDGGAAAYTIPLEEMIKRPAPDPETSGNMPLFKKSAEFIRNTTPTSFKINMPDFQGPFNLVHSMIGDDAFTAPYTDPEDFHKFMGTVTDFWIRATELLFSWIGEDRLRESQKMPRIAECSVNMVSPAFYREHILPHDKKVAARFGRLYIHPCSGIHVFKETFENLPIAGTEAGMMIAPMAAPVISPRRALTIMGDSPSVLNLGQELPADWDEAEKIIDDDIELALTNPHIRIGGYTGLYWRKKDRPRIRELHKKMDRRWEEKFVSQIKSK